MGIVQQALHYVKYALHQKVDGFLCLSTNLLLENGSDRGEEPIAIRTSLFDAPQYLRHPRKRKKRDAATKRCAASR